jgi:peptidoglycan/LPS O-acetylase OafA/YrhL
MQNQPETKVNHFPGFDGIRLFAAVAVIFSHSFLIATGTEESEPLVHLMGSGNSLGLYGVFVFFIISGFLLSNSLHFDPSITRYSVNRTLRIVPAFAICILVSAFVIGPLCTSVPLGSYFSSSVTWNYVLYSLNGFGDWPLPGVFAYVGRLSPVVNGSLWSLAYEALSYVFLMAVWTFCRSAGFAMVTTVAVALGTWLIPAVKDSVVGIAYTLPYFAGGVLMQWIYIRYGTKRGLAVLSALLLILAVLFGLQAYAFALAGAYLVTFFGERDNPGSKLAERIGDCSYGLYLYGWPAEQIVKQFTGTTSPFLLFLGALLLAWGLAFLSCHLVEKPAMKWRGAVVARIRSTWARIFKGVFIPATIGARMTFVAGTILILTVGHWWLVVQSMGELFLAMLLGSALAIRVHRTGMDRVPPAKDLKSRQ